MLPFACPVWPSVHTDMSPACSGSEPGMSPQLTCNALYRLVRILEVAHKPDGVGLLLARLVYNTSGLVCRPTVCSATVSQGGV